jgi:hypothetical protein
MSELDEYLDSLPKEAFEDNKPKRTSKEPAHKRFPLAGIPGAGTATQGKILRTAVPNALSSAALNVPKRYNWGREMTRAKSSSPAQQWGAAIGQMAGSLVPTAGISKAAGLLGKTLAATKTFGPAIQAARGLRAAHPMVNAGLQGAGYGQALRTAYSLGERGDLEDAKITKKNLIMDPLMGMAGYGLGQLFRGNSKRGILQRKLRNFYNEMESVSGKSIPEMASSHKAAARATGARTMLETADEPLLRYGKGLAENPRNMQTLQTQQRDLLGRMRQAASRDIESIPGHANAPQFKESIANRMQQVRDTGYNKYRQPFHVKTSQQPMQSKPLSTNLDKYIQGTQEAGHYPSSRMPSSISGRSPNIPYTSPELPGMAPRRQFSNSIPQQTYIQSSTGKRVPETTNINAIPTRDAYELIKRQPDLQEGLVTLTREVKQAAVKSGSPFNPQSFTKNDLLNARNNIRAKLRAKDYQGQSMMWLRKANELATQMLGAHDPGKLFHKAESEYANLALQKRLTEAGESIATKPVNRSLKKHDLDTLRHKKQAHVEALTTGIKEALRGLHEKSTGDVLASQNNIYADVFQKSNVLNKAQQYIPPTVNATIRSNAKSYTKAYNNYKRLINTASASSKIEGKKHFSKFLTFFTRRLRYLAKAGDSMAKKFLELNSRQKLEILSRPDQFLKLWKRSKLSMQDAKAAMLGGRIGGMVASKYNKE